MQLKDFKNKKINPLRNLIAFQWQPPVKSKEGILIPESFFNFNLQLGKYFIGKILAIGPKVNSLKTEDKILIQEYAIKGWQGGWKKEEVYFIEETHCIAKVSGIKGLINRITNKKYEEHMLNA